MAGPERKTPRHLRAREARDRVPRGRARAGRRTRCRTPTRCTRSRSSRAAARSGTRSRCRPRTSSSSRAQRARRRARDAARRPHRRGADLRRPHHRRAERHRPGDDDRPPDGHRVRHERRLGPLRFGQPQGEVFLGRDFASTPDYSDEVAAPHRRRGASPHRATPTAWRARSSRRTGRRSTGSPPSSSSTRRSRPSACRRSSPTSSRGHRRRRRTGRAEPRPRRPSCRSQRRHAVATRPRASRVGDRADRASTRRRIEKAVARDPRCDRRGPRPRRPRAHPGAHRGDVRRDLRRAARGPEPSTSPSRSRRTTTRWSWCGTSRCFSACDTNLISSRFRRARGVRVTLDHPVLTPGGYASAGELSVGDKVLTVEPRQLCRERRPVQEGYHLGYVLGAVASDASIQERRRISLVVASRSRRALRTSSRGGIRSRRVRGADLGSERVPAAERCHVRVRSSRATWPS